MSFALSPTVSHTWPLYPTFWPLPCFRSYSFSWNLVRASCFYSCPTYPDLHTTPRVIFLQCKLCHSTMLKFFQEFSITPKTEPRLNDHGPRQLTIGPKLLLTLWVSPSGLLVPDALDTSKFLLLFLSFRLDLCFIIISLKSPCLVTLKYFFNLQLSVNHSYFSLLHL